MPPYFQGNVEVGFANLFNCLNRHLADPEEAKIMLLRYAAGYRCRGNTHYLKGFDKALTSMQKAVIHKGSKICLEKYNMTIHYLEMVSTIFALEIE